MNSDTCPNHGKTSKTSSNSTLNPKRQRVGEMPARGVSIAFVVILMLAASLGCGGDTDDGKSNKSRRSSNATAQGRVDNLQLALDLIFSPERYQSEAFTVGVSSSLNEWATSISEQNEWQPDPLIETLSDEYQQDIERYDLERIAFSGRDAESLQESRWLSGLTRWLSDEDRFAEFRYLFASSLTDLTAEQREEFGETDDRLAYLVEINHPQLSPLETKQMATSLRVFDWIIRNIQLVELKSMPSELEIQVQAIASAPGRSPSAKGVPGPGYTLFPWQSLKFGRGDAWQRSRVFILALRQLDIDAVMLAIPNEEDGPQPWLPAVRFGEELFLFDTELGMVIPESDGAGIATLTAAATDPEVLGALKVGPADKIDESIEYRVTSEQAASVVALIDAGPEWLSKRMAVLEASITGDRRLILTLDASGQAERISQCPNIAEVKMWDLPYETLAYRNTYEQVIRRGSTRLLEQYLLQEAVFDLDIGLMVARHRAILGMIENNEEEELEGAKAIFFTRRFPDEYIDMLDTEPELRAMYGIDALGDQTAEERQQAVQTVKVQIRMVRTHASYWLALAHFDAGTPGSAENWFRRVAENDPRKSWADGTHYNTGRSFESIGEFGKAIDVYRASQSPQRQGDFLRARILDEYFVVESGN